jgi:hypothetical protein
MTLTRADWRKGGDLIEWIVRTYPGLSNAEVEAGYRLLADPGISESAGDAVEMLLEGCAATRKEADG